MSSRRVSICGVGAITDSAASAYELCTQAGSAAVDLPRVELLEATAVEGKDRVAQWAIRAGHQAWMMAGMDGVDRETVGLVFVSAWGTIESTEAYLESMLAEEGRYASPRHFSRSVFSSVASVMAIHFGIHGPCETLSFDEGLVEGAMMRAWALLAARRCQRVLVVWAEEWQKTAEHLAVQAVKKLGKKAYSRYVERGLGEGAVAVVVGEDGENRGALGRVDVGSIARLVSARTDMMNPGKPFAADESVAFLRWFLEHRSR